MQRRITVALLALACTVAGAPNAEAKSLTAKYHVLRHEVVQKHGERAPGRNIVRDGVRTKHGARPARNADIAESIDTFRRWLAPPPPAPVQPVVAAVAPTSGLQSAAPAAPSSGSCGAIPSYIVGRESGGDPNAVNSSSGAFGCYQLLPQHFEGGGRCADLGRDQAGQDECATRLWDGGAGSSNWALTR